jgi:hypothetical protein
MCWTAGLMFSEYICSGCIPSVKEVNDEEPIFPGVPFLDAQFKSRSVSLFILVFCYFKFILIIKKIKVH